jgi:SMODS and SLOG-associating 2TM effector domain 1
MMCASPFEGGSDQADAEAEERFDLLVHEIATQEAAPVPKSHEITPTMHQVRHKTLPERARLYLRERIEDQRSWYATNSDKNDAIGTRALYTAVATQVIACIIALILISYKVPDFGAVFATVSASALAWMQIRRYEDLAQAYETAAKELSKIGSTKVEGFSEEQLSRFVLDAENAISREHTLWLAKRT